MRRTWKQYDREQLLADVAEMYYREGLTQQAIGTAIGMTRSAVSRLLTEAQARGIVEIRINHPTYFDDRAASALADRFNLKAAHVLLWHTGSHDKLRRQLGEAAARVLADLLPPGGSVGLTWGTTIKATIDALAQHKPPIGKVVQLVGSVGARNPSYDAHGLVQRLAGALGCEPVYLHAPFLVENEQVAQSLRETAGLKEAIQAGRSCDVILVGIGSIDIQYSSLYLGGHITLAELKALQAAGAVGDACGYHYTINGRRVAAEFHCRLVGIAREDLLASRLRLGIAGGLSKVEALLGALRGGYINVLVTDSITAEEVLRLDRQRPLSARNNDGDHPCKA
ncbi:MAG: sugar-binding domain-containing protein [Anaerolineae bacterium]